MRGKVDHVKGPWRIIRRSNQTGPRSLTVVDSTSKAVTIYPQGLWIGATITEEDIVRASLIAAAPEMLAALVMVLEGHENGEPLEEHGLRAVENAIKKAKGENHG